MSRTYTYDQVSRAVNDGADLVAGGLSGLGDMERDLAGLVASAALTKLQHPRVRTLDGVIRHNYSDPPAQVRAWREWD